MNPYFQESWSNVHVRLITYIGDALAGELPDDLTALAEEGISVTSDGNLESYRADVAVVESWEHGFPPVWRPEGAQGMDVVAEPLVFDEPGTQRWVEIRDVRGKLITAIEVISPANKRGGGWFDYRSKQRDLLAAGVNLVEIDFIRGGSHATAISPERLIFPDSAHHHICAARQPCPGSSRREVYHCPLRKPLPVIRVPLRATDPDAPLALQPLIDRCYQTGRYWHIDHAANPEPPLSTEDTVWVDECLRAAGLRK